MALGGNAPEFEQPTELFEISGGSPMIPYDEAPDGTFVVSRAIFNDSDEPLQLTINWQEKLRAK
jgi:hypothetical protein